MSDEKTVNTAKLMAFLGKRRMVVLLAALLITSLVATGFVWAHKQVHVAADGRDISVSTLHSNPVKILAQAGIDMGPADEYRLSTTKIASGTTIEVFRAIPVAVTYQGKTQQLITGKPTVGEIVEQLGIAQDSVKVVPDGTTRTTPGMNIKVIIMTAKTVEKEVPVPYSIIRQPDGTMEKGEEKVIERGEDGTKTIALQMHYADGELVRSEQVGERISREPKPQINHVGTRDTIDTSRGTMRFKRVEWMEATAYNPTDGAPHGLTATGIAARHGIVAVDPDVIPLGSRVFIPNYGLALAADTGGAIIGHKIDLCMESYDEAWRFGRRTVKVYVLD